RKAAVDLAVGAGVPAAELDETYGDWDAQTRRWERGLWTLLTSVQRQAIPRPSSTEESLLEYDRRRGLKDQALHYICLCLVDARLASLWLRAAQSGTAQQTSDVNAEPWEHSAARMLHAVLYGDHERARGAFPELQARLDAEPILYTPLTKGGEPKRIVN